MEVCGTHTVAVGRGGLRDLLPPGLRLVSGPGCPVCVTDQSYMDACVLLSRRPDVIIATYGDMIRVPGRVGSLEESRSAGATVEVVASAFQALDIARANPTKTVVWLGVGFETTTPGTALAVLDAAKAGVKNFLVFSAHKLVLPAMMALLQQPDVRIDGFLCPGHVSVILGYRAYEPVVAAARRPCVVAGFEDRQILAGITEILREIATDSPKACTVYPVVSAEGNVKALQLMARVFRVADDRWRALGVIPGSGLQLADEYAEFDAAKRLEIPPTESYEMPGCRCGDVICGRCIPTDCPLFARVCTPHNPIGPCMVSSEGSCSAYYRFGRHDKRH
jgi:hydrogenase expression/formation protein HypD